jgi:DNA-directed RNA polymerase specialized sigma24 family protein
MDIALPPPALIQELGSPAFKEMLPRLSAYARRCLRRAGWAEGRDHAPCEAEATDVIDGAVESCLAGERRWKAGVDLFTFLCNVMRSQVYSRRRRAERVSYIEETAEPLAPSSRRDAVMDARRLLAGIEQAVEPDPETSALFTTMVECFDSDDELGDELGWSPRQIRTVRARMNRRIFAAGLQQGEDDEEESRSDGPPRGAAASRRGAR